MSFLATFWQPGLMVMVIVACLFGFKRLADMQFMVSEERTLRIELRQILNGLDSHLIFAGKLQLLADDADRLIAELRSRCEGVTPDVNPTFADLKDTHTLSGRIIGYQRLVASVSIPGLSDKFRKYKLHDGGSVLEFMEILKDHVHILNDMAAEAALPYINALSSK